MSATRADAAACVVMILPTYLPESFGGAEQQARKLALALKRHGVSVTILAPRLFPQTAQHETDEGISVIRLRVRHAPNLGGRYVLSFLCWCVKLAWWLARHRNEYGIIHVIHGRLHAVPAVLMARILGKSSLVKIGRGGVGHFDLDILRSKRIVGKWYARAIAANASGYVANSREIADDLTRWHISNLKIHQIPNGVELPQMPASQQEPVVRCVFHGRLDPEKAIDVMIRGFAQLPKNAAVLSLVGDGDCRQQLERLVDELDLRDRIFFTGPLADVRPTLLASNIYVSTSVSEGMSNALLEAMSFGLLPVVSRVSGVLDIVEDGHSGLLFAVNDAAAFAARLRAAVDLTDSARREMGLRARQTVSTRFGIDRIALEHKRLYEQLVESQD
jgi:glycosyltransferase involved in cell wall biosynthesis